MMNLSSILNREKKSSGKAERINLFEESGAAQELRKAGIEEAVRKLAKQFKEVEDAYRELIQNSIDSDTNQIDVYFTEEDAGDGLTDLTVNVEDYGCGMDDDERVEFFLNLHKSSKKDDEDKIGQYGIGIASILALEPHTITVESSKGNMKGWSMVINDVMENPKTTFDETNGRIGTRVGLTKRFTSAEAEEYKKKVRDKIAFFCERSRTPIYVEDDLINIPFDLDTRVKVSGGTMDTEYVMGVGLGDGYEFFNTRLKLEEGSEELIDEGIYCLISSKRFSHSPSRDKVRRNEGFSNVMNNVRSKTEHLFLKSLEAIEHYQNLEIPNTPEPPKKAIRLSDGTVKTIDSRQKQKSIEKLIDEKKDMDGFFEGGVQAAWDILAEYKEEATRYEREKENCKQQKEKKTREMEAAWSFVKSYIENLSRNTANDRRNGNKVTQFCKKIVQPRSLASHLKKKLPQEISQYPVFDTLSHGRVSLSALLDAQVQNGHVVYMSRGENIPLLEELTAHGLMVMDTYRMQKDQEKALRNTVTLQRASDHYSLSPKTDRELTEAEQAFIQSVWDIIPKNMRRRVSEMYAADKEKLGRKADSPFIYRFQDGRVELGESETGGWTKTKGFIKDLAYGKNYEVAINIDHPMIQHATTIHSVGDDYAKETAMGLISSWIDYSRPRYS